MTLDETRARWGDKSRPPEPPWLAQLHKARYQAVELENSVYATELCARVALAGPEARLHARRLGDWIAARATEPLTGAAAGCGVMLIDEHSMQPFYARLEPAPAGEGSELLKHVQDALATAASAAMRLLAERRAFEPARIRHLGLGLIGPPVTRKRPLRGSSLGAAAALTLFARWSGVLVPCELIVCAGIDESGKLHPTGHEQLKVAGVLREHPGARVCVAANSTLAPQAGVLRLESLADLHALLHQQTTAARDVPIDIEASVRLGVELYEKKGAYRLASIVLGQAIDAIDARRVSSPNHADQRSASDDRVDARDREAFLALWRRAAALTHLGRLDQAEADFERARTLSEVLWADERIDAASYLGFRGNLAVYLRDRFLFDEAERLLEETLALQRQLRVDKRQRAKTLGNLGELCSWMQKHERAETLLQQARENLAQTYRDELPRALCNLANAALARRDYELAISRYQDGLALNVGISYGAEANAAYLRYGLARALLYRGSAERACEVAFEAFNVLPKDQPHPRPMLVLCAGLADLTSGQTERGLALLREVSRLSSDTELLQFGFRTASAHLLLYLGNPAHPAEPTWNSPEPAALLDGLMAAAKALPGLPHGSEFVRRLQAAPPLARQSRPLLRQLCAAFPYGIEAIF